MNEQPDTDQPPIEVEALAFSVSHWHWVQVLSRSPRWNERYADLTVCGSPNFGLHPLYGGLRPDAARLRGMGACDKCVAWGAARGLPAHEQLMTRVAAAMERIDQAHEAARIAASARVGEPSVLRPPIPPGESEEAMRG